MRFVTFKRDGIALIGVLDRTGESVVELGTLDFSYCDMNDLIANLSHDDFERLNGLMETGFSSHAAIFPLCETELLAPVPRPIHDIICLGFNYIDHASEFEHAAPTTPVYFSKRAAVTTGHRGTVDGNLGVDPLFDYEVELAVVIGRHCRNVTPEQAEDCIFGYTILNEFSSRGLQKERGQYFLAKSGDGYAAMGPCIVTRDELPFPLSLKLESRVNGERRQCSNTENLLFGIPEILADLSRTISLKPGDIISTGTPSGVGIGFEPHRCLCSGDTVECEIEKIGTLTVTVK